MVRLYLVLPIGMIAVSTASIFIKLCEAPALIIAAYRVSIASLLLAPFAFRQGVWKRWERSDVKWLVSSGILLGLHFAFWIASLKYTSVASSVVLVTSHPVFVGIGAWLFLGERPGLNLVAGIALSVFGSGLISYGDLAVSRQALFGDGLALLGAVTISGYLMVGRKLRGTGDLLSYIFPVYATAGIVLLFACFISGEPFVGYSRSTYFFIILLAVVPQLIGHTSFNWALKYLPASMVAIAILGEPVGSTLLAYIFLGEGLSSWKIFGGILIFSGILIALKKR